jgi:AcrR family transcriptional regulator
MRRIAAAADMAPALIYSHFEGKREVLRAIFERSMADVRASFRAAEGNAEGNAEDPPLARLIRSAFAILRGNLPFWKLTYGVRMQEAALRDLGPDLETWTRQIRAALEAHFRAAGSPRPEAEAAALFAAIDGMGQHFALDPDHYPLEAAAGALIARYTRHPGAGKPGRTGGQSRPVAAGRRRKAGSHGSPESNVPRNSRTRGRRPK